MASVAFTPYGTVLLFSVYHLRTPLRRVYRASFIIRLVCKAPTVAACTPSWRIACRNTGAISAPFFCNFWRYLWLTVMNRRDVPSLYLRTENLATDLSSRVASQSN